MKKFLIFFVLFFCTSYSYATNYFERSDLNIIVNSQKIDLTPKPLTYNNFTLVPVKNLLSYFDFPNKIDYYDNVITLKRYDSILTLNINNNDAIIDNNHVSLDIAPIIYKNFTYVPLKIISKFFDCYIYYDTNSKTIFIKDMNEYQQIESFFYKLNSNLNSTNSVRIDIINELCNEKNSFSIGNSIYINKNYNTILTKNVLDDNWKISNIKVNFQTNDFFNTDFFTGISFDRINSNENNMIFYGFYPINDTLCKTKIYVDTSTLKITKQENEFMLENLFIRQNIFYSYDFEKNEDNPFGLSHY